MLNQISFMRSRFGIDFFEKAKYAIDGLPVKVYKSFL